MVDRVSFSNLEQSLDEVATYHADAQAGIFDFFAGNSQRLIERYSDAKLNEVRDQSLAELDLTSSLSVLSSVEAAIRLDYLRRVYGRWRDPLSRSMKYIHRKKGNRARLDDELVRLWRDEAAVENALLSELIGAFNFRHWLAHGRYWTPKFGRRYDFPTVFDIAQEFIDAMEDFNRACDSGKLGVPRGSGR